MFSEVSTVPSATEQQDDDTFVSAAGAEEYDHPVGG